ncbi:ESX-1 secretion-associated protein [Streptomyces sp. GS7]|uniref:ESX-1 secretion-associated protein n=1 Tax=Streptomyces sp. GS7 TaxID=2692234 RepID=UPI00131710AE|nr:ESX-1 secretion-associated protein [Streptomyces sp. GS7]QHC24564.1 ESX-1 secretion-associated protein [Streptomyces sp. GS7]
MTCNLFSFRPEPVTVLAQGLTASADHLDSRVREFAAQAGNVTDASGPSSGSTEVHSPYAQMTRHTATALREISADLRDHASGLHHAVASYEGAEYARAQQFLGK